MTTKIAYLIHRLIAATPKENQMLKFIKNEMNRAKRKLIASISRLPRIAPMPMHHPAELIKNEVQPKIKIDPVVQKVQKKNSAPTSVQITDEIFHPYPYHDLYSIEPTRVAVVVADTIISGNDGNFGGGGATGSYAQDSERQVLTPYIPPAPEPYHYSPSHSPSPSPSPSPSYDYYSSSESSSSSDTSSFSCD